MRYIRRIWTPIEMGIVIGKNYVITIYDEEIAFLEELYQEFQQIEGRMDNPGAILYHILDRCVDEYTLLVDHVEDRVEKMERGIFQKSLYSDCQGYFSS